MKIVYCAALVFCCTVGFVGCSQKSDTKPAASTPKASADAPHTHGAGPNGGVIFDLGKYHAEFTVEHPKQQCMILVIGADEKTPTAVAVSEFTLTTKETKTADGKVVPPMTIPMKAQDVVDGKATKFVGTDPGLGNVADFEGVVIGEIEGKPSQGQFKE